MESSPIKGEVPKVCDGWISNGLNLCKDRNSERRMERRMTHQDVTVSYTHFLKIKPLTETGLDERKLTVDLKGKSTLVSSLQIYL